MLVLDIVKASDSHIIVPHGTVLHANSSYPVIVTAEEFREMQGEPSRLDLVKDGSVVAWTVLQDDPWRRTRRTGSLTIGDASGEMKLYAYLGASVLFSHPVNVEGAGASVDVTQQEGRWTVVDLGTVVSGSVQVSDLMQVKLSASYVAEPLSVAAPAGPFEAYVSITGTGDGFPFTGVLVNGVAPVWDHMDSLELDETGWTLRLVGVAGTVHADLRAGRPSGAELDGSGDLVVSVEVNR